jgi:hypothetical protein
MVIKIYKAFILFILYECAAPSLTLKEDHRLNVFWEQNVGDGIWL